jgi:hypothetical protein
VDEGWIRGKVGINGSLEAELEDSWPHLEGAKLADVAEHLIVIQRPRHVPPRREGAVEDGGEALGGQNERSSQYYE